MHRFSTLSVFCLLPLLSACAPAGRPVRPRPAHAPSIDTLTLRAHTFFLAHDLLRGRATGSHGAAVAANYIVSECRRLGLEPVGGSFMHAVPLELSVPVAGGTALTVFAPNGDSARFTLQRDFVPTGGSRASLRGFAGQLVWVGGADEIRERPEALPTLSGAVAVTAGAVRRPAAEILARHGAVGMVHLIADTGTYRLHTASRGRDFLVLTDTTVRSSFFPPIPAVIAGPQLSRALVAAARRGGTVRVTLDLERRPVHAANIACLLPGADERLGDTALVFTAHYDHLGIGTPDERSDSIYNGFSDNAAGVAMLLAIAEEVRNTPERALRHSVLFLFFTGEERGLLGSDYFVARPPVPLSRMRALINLDAGAPPARPWHWRVAGGTGNPLGALAKDVAASHGWSVTTSPATANSDYYPFAQEGVASVFIIPRLPYQGLSADSSQALQRRWDRYHQAADEFYEEFPFAGLQRYAEFAYLLALAVDRNPGRIE